MKKWPLEKTSIMLKKTSASHDIYYTTLFFSFFCFADASSVVQLYIFTIVGDRG